MTKKELINNIKKEIKKSGIPLEIYVLDICSKKNTGRMPNQRYIYEDKLMEIDLHAFFEDIQFESKKKPQHTVSNLIIECKKSINKAWVFFSSPMHQNQDQFCFLKYLSTYDLYFDEKGKYRLLSQIWNNVKKNHYRKKNIRRCISYFEAFKTPNQESDIYKAIRSVLSFIKYDMQMWANREWDKYEANSDFYYPIIVVDGFLFEAIIKDNKTTVKERNHIQIRTTFDDEIFIVDVVKKEYFESFFNILEQNHVETVQAINKMRIPKEFQKIILEKQKKRMKEFKFDVKMFTVKEDEEC